ncbi:MAG: hypothetical protein J4400_05380 [Candidatus Aenigmarchaeota archaeon]|nr:hypothetical protein [Candidatus Aenigmarchaeota archaeon]
MKPVKFLALVISAIMVTLSIPHISLISIGSGVAEAATQKVYAVPSSLSIIGKLCPGLSGKYRCASKSGRFEVVTCAPHNVWVEPDQNLLIVRDSYGACRTYCEGTYSSSCIEPYSTVTRDPETNMNPGQQIMTFTSTTSYPFTSSSSPGYQDVRSHTIQFKEVGSVNRAWTTWNCGTEKTCPAQNTFTGAIAGNTIQYWSDIVFEDGTRVRNPQTGEYSFLLSSAGGTSGGLTGPSSMTIAVGAATTSQISGGTGAHTATSSATNIATATISGTTLTARGVLAGTATITVRDSSPSQKTATIQVTVTSGGTPRLTVTKSGSGTVTSNPNGINCGSTCWYDFSQGSLVTLTANQAVS